MNKKLMVFMTIVIVILIVLLSVFATLYFTGNNKDSANPIYNNETNNNEFSTETEKLKNAFRSEKYEEYKWGFRKYIKENPGETCTPQEYYGYTLDEKIFEYVELRKVDNRCITKIVKYYITLDIVELLYTSNTPTGSFLDKETCTYNYATGVNDCSRWSSLTHEVRNQFTTIKNKYNINIDAFK